MRKLHAVVITGAVLLSAGRAGASDPNGYDRRVHVPVCSDDGGSVHSYAVDAGSPHAALKVICRLHGASYVIDGDAR